MNNNKECVGVNWCVKLVVFFRYNRAYQDVDKRPYHGKWYREYNLGRSISPMFRGGAWLNLYAYVKISLREDLRGRQPPERPTTLQVSTVSLSSPRRMSGTFKECLRCVIAFESLHKLARLDKVLQLYNTAMQTSQARYVRWFSLLSHDALLVKTCLGIT